MHANKKPQTFKSKALTPIFALTVLISGCTSIPSSPPTTAAGQDMIMKPIRSIEFGDGNYAILTSPIRYEVGESGIEIEVPKGFVTDHASIPQFLWSFGLTRHGLYGRAAIVHDYLYWSKVCSRKQADNILEIAMKEHEVGAASRFIISTGLSLFGSTGWDENKADSDKGYPRVIPEQYWDFDPKINWPQYRQQLAKMGVKDPVWPKAPSYCKLGDTTNVPSKSSNPS